MIRKNSVKALGFFMAVITLSFGSTLWYYKDYLKKDVEYNMGYVDEAEWYLIETVLHLKLTQAHDNGQSQRNSALLIIDEYDKKDVSIFLDNLSSIGNPVRQALYDVVKGFYFDGIQNDANDSFIMRYQDGWTIDMDDSSNCSTVGSVRTLDKEYPMHANPKLAKIAFERITKGMIEDYSKPAIYKPIFFQFVSDPDGDLIKDNVDGYEDHFDKKAVILKSYDLEGLKAYFHKTQSWEKTFRSFEFITPTYLDPRIDLAGRPYVQNGIKTGNHPIIINTVFNFADVIRNMPEIKTKLDNYKARREELRRNYIKTETTLLLVIILLSIIFFVSLLYSDSVAKGGDYDSGRNKPGT
jgi:hypothetical protein